MAPRRPGMREGLADIEVLRANPAAEQGRTGCSQPFPVGL